MYKSMDIGDKVIAIEDVPYFMYQPGSGGICQDDILTIKSIDKQGYLQFEEIPCRYGPFSEEFFFLSNLVDLICGVKIKECAKMRKKGIGGCPAGRIIFDDFNGETLPFDVKTVDETGIMRMYKIDRMIIRKKVEKVARSKGQVDHYMKQLPDVDLHFGRDGRKLVCLQYGVNVVVASCNKDEDDYDENLGLFVCLVKIAKRISSRRKAAEKVAKKAVRKTMTQKK